MHEISENKKKVVSDYFAKNLNSLYSELGKYESSMLFAGPLGFILLLSRIIPFRMFRGRYIIRAIRRFLKRKICEEWDQCSKRNDPNLQDTVNLIATIADVICNITFGFPPILIATIIVKKGINSFCGCKKGYKQSQFGHMK